jgi:hypothetical protein
MPGRATLTMAGPRTAGERLAMVIFSWEEQLRRGPVHVQVAADGIPLGTAELRGPEIRFERSFSFPEALIGRPSIQITLSTWPVARVGTRTLGIMVESVFLQASAQGPFTAEESAHR